MRHVRIIEPPDPTVTPEAIKLAEEMVQHPEPRLSGLDEVAPVDWDEILEALAAVGRALGGQ
jgi:hypothetical protein